jgi:uncharacterized protein (TIGR00369 family)
VVVPPNVFVDMGGVFLKYIENEKLVARFPNRENYMNPVGFMQGGIITAAIDNTASPLSYTLGPPNITKEITTTFKRPITKLDTFIEVTATVREITETNIKLNASARNERGKLAATAETICVFIKPRKNASNE